MIPRKNILSKIIGLLPHGAPAFIYNSTLRVPVLRDILGAIVRRSIPEKVETNGSTIFLDREDIAVSGSIALKGFESFETGLFLAALRPGMKVADIGAHIGYYSLLASRTVGQAGRVFSFEPEPRNRSFLEKNVAVNGSRNVTIIAAAASDAVGEHDLYIQKYNKGHHSFGRDGVTTGKITVKTTTLDEALHAYSDPALDIIKIDIEGAEPIALRGMQKTIARSPNLVIFSEVYPRCMNKLGESAVAYLSQLRSLGFSLSVIDDEEELVKPIENIKDFVQSIPKNAFRNIIARRG